MFTHAWITLCPLCWWVAFAWLPWSLSWNWNEKQLSFGWIVFGYLTNTIQTPYLCSITIGMVVCIYKRTTDLMSKILKNHLPLERNTWHDCSSCDIENVFWHLPIRTWQKSRITIDFCLLSFLIAAVFVSCCAYSLSKHLYLDKKFTKGSSNELCGQFLWQLVFQFLEPEDLVAVTGVCYSWWILVFRGSCRKLIMSKVRELDIANTENFYQKLPLQMFVRIAA